MARTVDALLGRLKGWLPPHYSGAEPLLAGLAAAMRQAELVIDDLEPLVDIGTGEGIWLTLQARGYGVRRASGESDASLRARLRNVEDALTRGAILDAVRRVLQAYGHPTNLVRMIEWYEEPFLNVSDTDVPDGGGFYLGSAHLSGRRNTFLIVVPELGDGFAFGEHLDSEFHLDSSYLGVDQEPPVYAAILAEVERLRAAGVRWRLAIE